MTDAPNADRSTSDRTTPSLGMTVSSEEHPPRRLVELACEAEAHGFDFISISDHYHPWVGEQGHSGFVWGVLGAISARTERIEVAVGVTCPIMRIHPAIVAHAAATASLLLEGRFRLGVGTGEALNEHILGDRWPPADIRLDMLEEAVDVMRQLWTGESITHRGTHFVVENARIFDPPEEQIPVIMSAFGPNAAELAGRQADGLWTSAGAADLVDTFAEHGGTGPRYAQITLCWAEDRDEAIATAHRVWPNTSLPGQLSQDLPTTLHFEQAAEVVTEEMIAESIPCGPDPQPIVDEFCQALEAGIDHVYFHQIGRDQQGFLKFWDEQLRPGLDEAINAR
jgi:coenzyme F420-dependent glucose-6-phosphate dehydrogenase